MKKRILQVPFEVKTILFINSRLSFGHLHIWLELDNYNLGKHTKHPSGGIP